MHSPTHSGTHTLTQVCTQHVRIHSCTHTHVCIHAHLPALKQLRTYACHTRAHTHMLACRRAWTRTYARVHARTRTHAHAHARTRTHACAHAHAHTGGILGCVVYRFQLGWHHSQESNKQALACAPGWIPAALFLLQPDDCHGGIGLLGSSCGRIIP